MSEPSTQPPAQPPALPPALPPQHPTPPEDSTLPEEKRFSYLWSSDSEDDSEDDSWDQVPTQGVFWIFDSSDDEFELDPM